ncbi:IPT/TIG domain-containing protein [Heterostelium album PN500]|uniref:IPT/TIG domain-containing protein n=1 Tax=Heterostelium pallidum (strain ATCC 26659 / Pp 5 / PN500) TaxID=670386 RepID=D3BNR2_HETP5|nr:IPT/TIG domain-containing protein [Heterostelium album PN500]EFA76831.1 IPT/TIG domain-containing protein [Heterostelium album PN500]|eukprot:XP_020428963.1 IPT/TIG domain-containing protein [Heterostelium album PN500]
MAEEIISRADALHLNREYATIYTLLEEAHQTYPDNVEISWRLARSYYDKNEEVADKAQKLELLNKAMALINESLAKNEQHWALHKWWSIITSGLGDHLSAKEKIANAYKIKEHALRSLELKPEDPTTLHLLGRWCFSVANIGWVERAAASALFGTPPTATFQEALDYYIRADKADPTLIRNSLSIADTYAALKDNASAKEWYVKVSKMDAKSDFEKNLVAEALKKSNNCYLITMMMLVIMRFLLVVPFSLQVNTYSFDHNRPIVTNDINSLREEYDNILSQLNSYNLNDYLYQQNLWDIVNRLNNLQYKSTNNSITLDWYSSIESNIVDSNNNINIKNDNNSSNNNFENDKQQLLNLENEMSKKKLKIVLVVNFEGMAYYTSLAKASGQHFQRSKIVVGLHGPSSWVIQSNTQNKPTLESEFELDYMERKSVELADVVWTPSTYIVNWLRKQGWTISPDKLALLSFLSPSVISGDNVNNKNKEDEVDSQIQQHQSFSSPIEEFVFFGRLEQRKGVILLTSTIKGESSIGYIRKRALQWPFAVSFISDKTSNEALDYLVKSPARLAIIPSLEDNAPYTLYECLYKSIPVIASSTASMIPLVDKRDRDSVLFDTKPHLLFRKLLSSIKKGVVIARPTFSASHSLDTWSSFYTELEQQQQLKQSQLNIVLNHSTTTNTQSTSNQPLVSVCIVHFNRPTLLKQALQSIDKQNYGNYEVILVDDGSNTTEALSYLKSLESQFKKRHWKLIRTANRYLGAARNTAVREASGEYIYFLDDDNAAYPNALATYVKVAMHTNADVVTSPHSIITTTNTPTDHTPIQRQWIPLGSSLSVGLFKNCFGDANFFIRRATFNAIGGFTEEYGVGLEDHELLAKLVIHGYKLAIATDPLLYYRIHDRQGQMVYNTDHKLNQMRYIRPYQKFLSDAKPVMKLLARNKMVEKTMETCNITLTGISPPSGPMTGGNQITIEGTGFNCPIQAVFIGGQQCQAMNVDANTNRITCNVPRGNTPLPTDVNVMSSQGRNYTLHSGYTYVSLSAPQVQTCTINAVGTTIQCTFTPETNVKPRTCEQYLTASTLRRLGEDPTCSWTDPKTLTITLGHASTTEIGDIIEFNAGSIESVGGEPNNRESIQLTSLGTLIPVATIKAPEDIGPCDELLLDGSYSENGAGSTRGLTYEWSVYQAASHVNELIELLQNSHGAKVRISNRTLDIGASYSFQLKVTNIQGKSHSTTTTVYKKAVDVVIVKIFGPNKLTVPARNLAIEGLATYTGCEAKNNADSIVDYQWSVSPQFPLDQGTATSRNLYVSSDSWIAGTTYVFTLTATIGRKSSFASIEVYVSKGPIYAVITGGDKTYGQNQLVTLDASNSRDPDGNDTTLSFKWQCSPVQFDKHCGIEIPDESVITFNATDLKPGKYIFQVDVSPDDDSSRASSAITSIVITSGGFIEVEINKTALPVFIDPGQKIVLRSILINNHIPLEQLVWSWTLDSGTLAVDESDAYSTPTNMRNLAFKSGALAGGTLYTYTVHVVDSLTNITGEASITFRTEARPSGGKINCYTQKGSIFDKYTIDMGRSWGAAAGIIGYSFTYRVDNDPEEFPLGDRSMVSQITTFLPPGKIKVMGYALSGNGVAASSSCLIHVDAPSNDDTERIIEFISTIMESPTLTLYEISFSLRLGNVLLPAVSNKNGKAVSNAQVAEKVSGFKTTAIDILNEQVVSNDSRITTERVTSMIDILNTATETRQILRPNILASAMGVMKSLSKGFLENPVLPTGINSSISVVGNINHQVNRQLHNIDPAMKVSVKTISLDLDLVAHQIANALLFRASSGEEATIISKQGVTISTFKQDPLHFKKNGAVAAGITGDPTFTIQPDALSKVIAQYTSHQEIGVKYITFPGNPHFNTKLESDKKFLSKNTFSLDLVSDEMKEIGVKGLLEPIGIDCGNTFDPDDNHECVWWDKNKQRWSDEGCVTIKRDTNFAVIGRGKSVSDWTRVAVIVGSVVGAALVAGLLVGMFVVVRRRRAAKKRTTKDKAKDQKKKKEDQKKKGKEKDDSTAKQSGEAEGEESGDKGQSSSSTSKSKKKKKLGKKEAAEEKTDTLNVPVVDGSKKKERIEQSFGDENDNEFILNEFKEIYEVVKKRELESAASKKIPLSPLTATDGTATTENSPTTSMPSYETSPTQYGPYSDRHSQAASAMQRAWRSKQHLRQLKRELEVEELVENIDDLLADETADPFEDNDYEAGDDYEDNSANQA